MPFNPNSQSRIVIFGRTRCGKTHLNKSIQRVFPRVIIIDTVGDYTADGKTFFFENFREFAMWMVKAQHHPEFRVVFRFSIHDQFKEEIADEIFKLVFSIGNVLVVVDEIQYYKNSHYYNQIILVGARHGIATISSTQRPANISKDVISQSSDIFIGQLFEPNDAKYLDGFLDDASLEAVVRMPKYKFLHFQPGESPQIISNDLTST